MQESGSQATVLIACISYLAVPTSLKLEEVLPHRIGNTNSKIGITLPNGPIVASLWELKHRAHGLASRLFVLSKIFSANSPEQNL